MRLSSNRWRFVSARTITKGDKSFTFMTFANRETYETNDFMAGRDLVVSQYSPGFDYDVTLDVDGKYINVVDLKPVTASKVS